jgi:hypothetical protein
MKKPTTCPCCKYSPRLTPKGNIYKGSLPFEEVTVSFPKHESYDYNHATVGLSCPKCGVIFKEVKS